MDKTNSGQSGQLFAGYIIAVFIVAALVVFAARSMRASRDNSQTRVYRELALNVARAGFEDGLSFFQRQPDGVYLDAFPNDTPLSQDWTTPWPQWPDAAFMPQAVDTDHAGQLTFTSKLGVTAGGIIRTLPLTSYSNTATSVERHSSNLWGRYVLRRQNLRNWSPGPNTMAAFTDPEAAHDLSHIRSEAKPGSGNYWSLFSRSYVFSFPNSLTIPAAHEGNSILSPPRKFYNGKRLLLATASVYGELFRINFNQPQAAVFVTKGNKLVIQTQGTVNGQDHPGYARPDNTTADNSHGGGLVGTPGSATSAAAPPSIAYCFPGLDKAALKSMASSIDPNHVGGISVLPNYDDVNFTDIVSRTSFYYLTTTGLTGGILAIDGSGATSRRVLFGVGLVIVDGSLKITTKKACSWTGVVFVNGDVTIEPPAEVSGTLIATGNITVGTATGINRAEVSYNGDAIDNVQKFLQNFRVLTSSIVASPN